jgi:phosphoserine aminotransferase
MTAVHRVHNFSAGPAVLPVSVLEEIQRDLVSLPGVGMSILEISHRSAAFEAILAQAEADIRALAAIPSNYKVLFLQGGASLQFSMVPMNLLTSGATADYIDSGSWAEKAIKEAKRVGTVNVAATTKGRELFARAASGRAEADAGRGVRPHDVEQHDRGDRIQGVASGRRRAARQRHLLGHVQPSNRYFPPRVDLLGRQKNMGPAGVTVVIVRDDLLQRSSKSLPTMLNYAVHAENGSMYNTPPAVRGLCARPGDEMADRERRPQRDCEDQRAQGGEAVLGDRSDWLLSRHRR